MNLQQLINQYSSPNNQAINTLRSNTNASTASGMNQLSAYGAGQGWGGNSSLLGKMAADVQNQGNMTFGSGLTSILNNQDQLLSGLVTSQAQMDLQKYLAQKAAQNSLWGQIGGGLGAGAGSILSALMLKPSIPGAGAATALQ